MKDKLALIFVISTLMVAGAVTAHAYTYTCEEGKFTIEVPEGWEVTVDPEDVFSGAPPGLIITVIALNPKGVSIDEFVVLITVMDYDKLKQELKKELGEDLTFDGLHKGAVKALEDGGFEAIADTYLTVSQASVMNLDSGFVLRAKYPDSSFFMLGGDFLKGNRLYGLGGGGDYDIYQANEDKIIKALNSFRALD